MASFVAQKWLWNMDMTQNKYLDMGNICVEHGKS